MNATTTTASRTADTHSEEYPFLVEEIDGRLKTGVCFIPSSKRFYEVIPADDADNNPETAWTLRDPRSGEIIEYETVGKQFIRNVMGQRCQGTVDADRWAEFRESYVNAEEAEIERVEEFLDTQVFEYDNTDEAPSFDDIDR